MIMTLSIYLENISCELLGRCYHFYIFYTHKNMFFWVQVNKHECVIVRVCEVGQ